MRAAPPMPTPPRLAPLAAFRSPFDNPLVLWLLVGAGLYVLYPLEALHGVLTGRRLPDSDDAMRLVQVRDLLAGQPWFDMTQHRLMPPGGAGMHWSRYLDAPLAALIALAGRLVGPSLAEGLVVALWPPVLFAAYLLLVQRAVSARFGPRAALLAVFAATQAGGLGPLFAFGRIDHHNVQVLAVVGLGVSLAGGDRSWRPAALAGALAAFSLAIGLETLPFLALAGLVLLVDWVRAGRAALPALAGFSLALALGGLVLFLGQTAPRLWPAPACDALSPPWLVIAAAAAATAGGAALLSPRLPQARHRAAYAALLGLVTIAGFAALFPACLQGPFHGMPEIVRRGWLDEVGEMQSFPAQWRLRPGDALAHLAPLLVAGLVAAGAALRGPAGIRRGALVASLFLLAGFAIGLVQFRGVYVASAFLAFVAGPVLDRAVTLLRREDAGWRRPAALLVALLMIARVWAAPFAAAAGTPSAPIAGSEPCLTRGALAPLDGIAPGVILAAVDLGPAILLQTRHAVVAAPYHRAIPGLLASVTGLLGGEAALRAALASSGATHLLLCGRPADPAPGEATPFATRLARGEASAGWLTPVPLPGSPALLWRVGPMP